MTILDFIDKHFWALWWWTGLLGVTFCLSLSDYVTAKEKTKRIIGNKP